MAQDTANKNQDVETHGFVTKEMEEGKLAGKVRDIDLNFTRILVMLEDNMDTQIARADHKAQLVLVANGILIASVGLDQGVIRDTFSSTISILEIMSLAFTIMVVISLLLSVFFALMTSRPNTTPPKEATNLFFFQHIAMMDPHDYAERFLDMDSQALKILVISQIHAKAKITTRKFIQIRYSLDFMVIGLALWMVARLLIAFV
jgi:hypothetical protein